MLNFILIKEFYYKKPLRSQNLLADVLKLWAKNQPSVNILPWGLLSQVLPHLGFLGGSMGNESARQYRRRRRHSFHLWIRKIPWRRAGQPTPVFLPEESHGQRSLAGYSPRGHKESDTAERMRMCAPSLMFNFVCSSTEDTRYLSSV